MTHYIKNQCDSLYRTQVSILLRLWKWTSRDVFWLVGAHETCLCFINHWGIGHYLDRAEFNVQKFSEEPLYPCIEHYADERLLHIEVISVETKPFVN